MAKRSWYRWGTFPFRFDGRLLYAGKSLLDLPEKEAHVLRLLLEAVPHDVSKEELRQQVFGPRADRGSVDSAVCRLRAILERPSGKENRRKTYVKTVPGRGYAFVHEFNVVFEPSAHSVAECKVGRAYWNERERGALWKAKECFDQALQRDRGFPGAHAALADCYAILGSYWWISPKDGAAKAKAAVERALEFDRTLAEPRATRGFVRSLFERRWSAAEAEFEHVVEHAPDYGVGHHWYALYLSAKNQLGLAIEEIEEARQCDANSRSIDVHAATIRYWDRNYDAAEQACERAIQFHPDFWYARYQLGLVHEARGRFEKAVETLEKASECLSDSSTMLTAALARARALAGDREAAAHALEALRNPTTGRGSAFFHLATARAALGDQDGAFSALNDAIDAHDVWVAFLAVDPRVDALRPDPRFAAALKRLNLA